MNDLIGAGPLVERTGRALAAKSDVIILCVTGSPAVETVLSASGCVLEGLRPGTIVVDCSTAIPSSTERMAALMQSADHVRSQGAEVFRWHPDAGCSIKRLATLARRPFVQQSTLLFER